MAENDEQKSSIPGLSSVTDTAGAGVGKAQEGIAAGGSGVQTVTDNIPVVGRVTEGVGNAPVAQKIAGKDPEAEQKGYLQGAYEYVSGAGKVVYDAAGNVIGVVGETASGYLSKAPKDGEGNDTAKLPPKEEGEEDTSYITRLKNTVLSDSHNPQGADSSSAPTTDSAAETAKTTTSQASENYGAATDNLKHGHRELEDTAQSGITDIVSKSTDAASSSGPSSSSKDDKGGTAGAASRTVDAAKQSTRAVEDQAQDTTDDAVRRTTAAASDSTGSKKEEEQETSPADTAKGAAGAAGDGAQAALGSVGEGVGDGVGKVGGMVGLGSGSKE